MAAFMKIEYHNKENNPGTAATTTLQLGKA